MNKFWKSAVLAASSLTLTPATAQTTATGPTSTAQAIVGAMHIERTLDRTFAQLMPLMTGNVIGAMRTAADVPAALKARLESDTGREQVGKIVAEEMMTSFRSHYPEIGTVMADEYRKLFTESELMAILAFYRSAPGAKLLDMQSQLQAALSEKGGQIGRIAGAEALPNIERRLQQLDKPAG